MDSFDGGAFIEEAEENVIELKLDFLTNRNFQTEQVDETQYFNR